MGQQQDMKIISNNSLLAQLKLVSNKTLNQWNWKKFIAIYFLMHLQLYTLFKVKSSIL